MSTNADENTHPDLLAGFSGDLPDGSTHVFWPNEPEQDETPGRLRIELDDGRTVSGAPVVVEVRVSTPGPYDVQAVLRVQGLEPGWCPRPQVVTISPRSPARLFVELTPAAGTPPGRYLWALTAEVRDRPMLATTAQLQVDRPGPAAPPAPPRRRRAAVLTVSVLLSLVLVALAGFESARRSGGRDGGAPAVAPPRAPHPRPTGRPAGGPIPTVLVRGTVVAEEGKAPIRISVVRLNLDDLSGTRVRPKSSARSKGTLSVAEQVHGEHWSLALPPGLYGLTFSKAGYVSESIVVATAVSDLVAPPSVRLDRVEPLS